MSALETQPRPEGAANPFRSEHHIFVFFFFLNLQFYPAICDYYKDAVPISGIGIGGK
jgi:hypothetical protein